MLLAAAKPSRPFHRGHVDCKLASGTARRIPLNGWQEPAQNFICRWLMLQCRWIPDKPGGRDHKKEDNSFHGMCKEWDLRHSNLALQKLSKVSTLMRWRFRKQQCRTTLSVHRRFSGDCFRMFEFGRAVGTRFTCRLNRGALYPGRAQYQYKFWEG